MLNHVKTGGYPSILGDRQCARQSAWALRFGRTRNPGHHTDFRAAGQLRRASTGYHDGGAEFGQHTDTVLRELLQADDDEINALRDADVIL
jgi:crotonobetainyl-CoA:carnitine CoA-transferase CaiB-like acyl-CoA transferase